MLKSRWMRSTMRAIAGHPGAWLRSVSGMRRRHLPAPGSRSRRAPDIVKEKHVFLKLKVSGRTIRAKAWNFADRAASCARDARGYRASI